ncbi:partitioning defective 6 homolog beta-like [Octopus vulgaris]|uniref:Partitioning defective 6 homolog beta-like n=2 Tax=Octopus TaxID=6643 RepID=A0AA36AII1_OCTVU|nr:partitioning defective protein 6 isoform X1 [Octopus sinensis]CAI9716174.1 partitioning defective 6 homolog beta-like [Octopus vulgaris]
MGSPQQQKRVVKNRMTDNNLIEVKSKFDAEFRRFAIDKDGNYQFEDFHELVEKLHQLHRIPFVITYTDPAHGDLLPINNKDNYLKAVSTARPLLRLQVQRKGESYGEVNGYGSGPMKRKNPISKLIGTGEASPKPRLRIGMPEEFRRVSAIIDVDIVPETHRRVKLMKNGSDKPLGFYIRDGTSFRVTTSGVEKVPGIFISRLVPGGLAESTGLLAVNDEVLEVNGIEVMGKTLDQVTDMMVANSANLIITVKPVNQRMTLAPQRGGYGRHSQLSNKSQQSQQSGKSYDSDDEDDVQELLSADYDKPLEDRNKSKRKYQPLRRYSLAYWLGF